MVRILIVEDDVVHAREIERALDDIGIRHLHARCAEEAIRLARQHRINMYVIDIDLPGVSGFTFAQVVRDHTNAPVIFMGDIDNEAQKAIGFEIGGDDFLVKPFGHRGGDERRRLRRRLDVDHRPVPVHVRQRMEPRKRNRASHRGWALQRLNFNNLENAVGRMSDQQAAIARQTDNGICNLGYENLRNFAQTQQTIQNGDYALAQQMSDCCCKTNRNIDDLKYNASMNTAAINENTTAQVQKVLDAICQGKIEALQAQVSQLQMQNALCGVVRYPSATTYNAGFNPYFNGAACGCGTSFAA